MNALPLSSTQIQEAMSRLSYFQGWRPDQLGRLATEARLLELRKNTTIVNKGDKLDSLFVLISGQVRIYIPLPAEGERVISLVEHGESFGEACLVLGEACPFDAITTRNSHVIAINAHAYQNELRHEPAQMERALNLVSKRLINTLRDLEICSQRSSLQRVACFLLQYMPNPDSSTYEIQLPARKRDIAAKLGLSQETFSRVLTFLGQQGVIQVKGSQISIENCHKLFMLSPGGCTSEAEVV